MPLIKARPKLQVRVPAVIRPGAEFVAVVLVDCRREVEVEWVHVLVDGTESFADPRHNSRTVVELLHLASKLCKKRTFEPGRTELEVRTHLPRDLPPSFRGTYVEVDYTLTVHAHIAWWPDARAEFELTVAPLPTSSPDPKPVFHASANAPRNVEPYAELSLACNWTRAGGPVRGAFALFNMQHNRYTGASIAVCATEGKPQGFSVRSLSYVSRVDVERRSDGEMIPFEFLLPPNAAPTFAGRSVALTYELVLTVHIPWGGTFAIACPFKILPRSEAATDAPPRIAPPSVGSDRLQKLWEAIGAQHGMRYEAHTLLGLRGEVTLIVSRQHRGREGTYLIATCSFPDLHLGLSIEPPTALDSLLADVTIGDEAFDDLHHVRVGDAEQARAFLRPLLPYLHGARITIGSDTSISVEVRDAGTSSKTLAPFIAGAAALADAIDKARQMIPPPRGLAPALPSWIELARRLGGTLERARMRVTGELEGISVHASVELRKGQVPRAMWLAVAPASPLADEHTFLWTAHGGPALTERFRGELGELVRAACDGASDLRIEPTRIVVALPRILGIDPLLTPELAQRRIERLVRIAMVLRGQKGPYR